MSEKKENRLKQWLEWAHHAYWIREFLGSIGLGGAIMTWLAKHFQVVADYKWPLFLIVSAILMYALGALRPLWVRVSEPESSPIKNPETHQASNALSRSLPHSPGKFDSIEFFRTAYYSPLQDVGANSYKAEAERVRPNDKESFYLDVLAVGTVAKMYDEIWWLIFRSQLLALSVLNGQSGMVPLGTFRSFYDDAAKEFASEYEKITFENWMEFLTRNTLIKIHPSQMVEITL